MHKIGNTTDFFDFQRKMPCPTNIPLNTQLIPQNTNKKLYTTN